MDNLILAAGMLSSYIIGSIPTGYIFGRILRGIDIRNFGSGNIGATNAFRVLGRMPGLIVLFLDMFKGYICATYLANIFMYIVPVSRPTFYQVLVGLSTIAGHNWTVFLKFRGGKGVATSAGVAIGLIPKIFLIGFLVWVAIFSATGFVSLASIISSISIPIFALIFGEPAEVTIFMSLLSLAIVYTHRSNIGRLLRGEEKRVSLFKKPK